MIPLSKYFRVTAARRDCQKFETEHVAPVVGQHLDLQLAEARAPVGCHQPGHWEAGMKLDIDV